MKSFTCSSAARWSLACIAFYIGSSVGARAGSDPIGDALGVATVEFGAVAYLAILVTSFFVSRRWFAETEESENRYHHEGR